MSSSSSTEMEVHASIWRAVAGAAVRIPTVNSYVYYFPQGHLEQCSDSAAIKNCNITQIHSCIPCQVISVRFLSDLASDQVFARILLKPMQPDGARPTSNESIVEDDDDDVVSFAKVLTQSDANNGGGFSVPRLCADSILPQLDFNKDPPFQNLVMRDLQNCAWEFRHIFRGKPRRHLLTTGWSKYVNAKRLIAGDAVVFMRKKSTNELFLGVRGEDGFRGDAGVGGAKSMLAVENAVRGISFEVVYYPKVGLPNFVVAAEKVEESLRMRWGAGMRVRMAVETDDSSRMTWIQGVINTAAKPATGPWIGSPWRMLQVSWEDDAISSQRVSPWEVECIPLSPLIDPDFHASKRLKSLPSDDHNKEMEMSYNPFPIPPTDFTHPPSMPVLLLHPYPAPGMLQGASWRDDHEPLVKETTHELAEANHNSTVLRIGSSYSAGGDADPVVGQPGHASSRSFKLFGKTIHGSSYSAGGDADPVVSQPGHASSRSFKLFGKTIQMPEEDGSSPS